MRVLNLPWCPGNYQRAGRGKGCVWLKDHVYYNTFCTAVTTNMWQRVCTVNPHPLIWPNTGTLPQPSLLSIGQTAKRIPLWQAVSQLRQATALPCVNYDLAESWATTRRVIPSIFIRLYVGTSLFELPFLVSLLYHITHIAISQLMQAA